MVKKKLLVLLILIVWAALFSFVSVTDSPGQIIDLNAEKREGYVADGGIGQYFQVEMWHYSGNYWVITFPDETGQTVNVRLYDHEAGENWNDDVWLTEYIKNQGAKLVLEYALSQETKDRLDAGTLTELEIQPVIHINHTVPDKVRMFNGDMEYRIEDGKVIVKAVPRINFHEETLDVHIHGLFKSIPIAREHYGVNTYAIYSKTKNPNTNKRDLLGVACADNRAEAVNPLLYSMIKNADGELHPGHTIRVGSNPVDDRASETLYIGDGTFRNGGAVGLSFGYNIHMGVYVKPEDDTTVTTTPSATPTVTEPPPEPTSHTETDAGGDMNPEAMGKIEADTRGSEAFHATDGIPSSESLYVELTAKEYLSDYEFTRISGEKQYSVKVRKTYQLRWEEDEGKWETTSCGSSTMYHTSPCTDTTGDGIKDSCPGHPSYGCRDTNGDGINDYCPGHTRWKEKWKVKTESKTIEREYVISRDYAYYLIDRLEIYGLDSAVFNNEALPDSSVHVPVDTHQYNKPVVTCDHSPLEEDHLQHPIPASGKTVVLSSETLNGGRSGKPKAPDGGAWAAYDPNWLSKAEEATGQIKVRNDSLVMQYNGNHTVMDHRWADSNAPEPCDIPVADKNNNAIFKENHRIEGTKSNGIYSGSGSVRYELLEAVNPFDSEKVFSFTTNDVVIHTPVVCCSIVKDDSPNSQELADTNERAVMVLGRPSVIQALPVGEHLEIHGYNNEEGEMDCRKYTSTRQVRFPFDAYIGTQKPEQTCFVPEDTWHTIPMDESCDTLPVYIPTWVVEGEYDVAFRQIAINASDTEHTETMANRERVNTVAVSSSSVKVVGRMYGFKITDVADLLWWDVFRADRDLVLHTGNAYYVGIKDKEGRNRGIEPLFTLPLLDGSHWVHKNRGVLKTGYTFRFELQTVGNYYTKQDFVQINPRFYYIKKDGSGRREVELWYHDDFDGKMNYFVKVDAEDTRHNNNPQSMVLGNIYRNVPDIEITDTARILGVDREIFKNRNVKTGWFDQILLSMAQRTFIGPKEGLPAGVNADTVQKSVQKWYGEYYLPNDLYATEPGFDVADYGRRNNGLTGKESFWLKDGYIIVNFDMETVHHNDYENPVLSYWGSDHCNMFEKEGYSYTKTDYHGETFHLQDGDIVFYDTDKRSSDDYRTGGTH